MVKRVIKPGREKLVKTVKSLVSSDVKVGYFADQGIHPEAHMSYPELMYLQEVTGIQTRNGKVHRRVFELTMMIEGKRLRNNVMASLQKILVRGGNPDSVKELFGKQASEAIKHNFGNTSLLPSNAPATIARKGRNSPLIETSSLQDKLTYRITKKGSK